MKLFLSILLGFYMFIISFFYFVPFSGIVNTYSSLTGAKIEAYEALKEDGVSTTISYEGSDAVEIKSDNLFVLLLINVLSLEEVKTKGMLASLFPATIDRVNVLLGFWSPHKPTFYFSGEFGEGSGSINLAEGMLRIEVTPEAVFKNNNSLIFSKARSEGDKFIFEYKL
ncbi:MAG: hypothetical protein ACLFQJ_04400 [Campylobacterales bacterium]